MAPKTPKRILWSALENLSKENFEKFCHALVDRPQDPRVRRNRVEGKNFLDVADVMISTFTGIEALKVTEEILRDIGCSEDADELASEAAALRSSAPDSTNEEHFVDKHRNELIQRVSVVGPILDKLLMEKVINHEVYAEIHSKSTNQAKIRAVYDGPLRAARACKDIFYIILKDLEPYLIRDLEGN
ncbi:transcript variant X2 [Nothobranchius furzeri]|uniref:Transcript variant X2 n=1 Tax=Nothobranchius furzeri TaxID=105023 RepID=A0A9D2YVN0_NOTFU|nr:transcript variant X2 [Nothobranchius furzeri]